jgi:hypothetical protein
LFFAIKEICPHRAAKQIKSFGFHSLCLFICPSLAGVRHELFLPEFEERRVGCQLAFGMPSVVLEVTVVFTGFVDVLFTL